MVVRLVVVAMLAATLPLVAPTPAVAATFAVTTTADVVDGDDGVLSLREAFIAANAAAGPDTIQLQAAVIYTLVIPGALEDESATGDLDSTGDLVIEGNGATIDAAGLDRVIDATAPLTVRDATITGGFVDSSLNFAPVSGGGVRSTTAMFENSTIRNNQVQAVLSDDLAYDLAGGGIWADTLAVTDSTVADNTVVVLPGSATELGWAIGGGLMSLDATVTGSTISGNSVTNESGEYLSTVGGGVWASMLSMSDTTVSDNAVDSAMGFGIGGGLAIGTGTFTDVSVIDNIIDGSGSIGDGGGLVINDGTITRAEISGNDIVGGFDFYFGGGLSASGSVVVSDSDIFDNSSAYGGGVYSGGDLTVQSSTIRDNVATQVGGGVASELGDVGSLVTIRDSTILGNTADRGGGVGSLNFAASPGAIHLERSLVANNIAVTNGGGVFLDPAASVTATVESSTVSGNTAASGGGLWLGSPVSLTDSTVMANMATTGGGVFLDPTSSVAAANSAVGDQGAGADCAGTGVVLSSGFNADTDGSCGLGEPTDLTVASLGLGVLADNGGPTSSHLPLPGSALADSGPVGCLAVDQRGVARPQGPACDRGAVETSYLAPTTTADVVDGGDGLLSLREAVDLANASGVDDTIVLGAGLTYELSICGSGEDANTTGDLDHTAAEALTVMGNGSTIEQTCGDRVLHNDLGALTLDGLTITGGDTTSVGSGSTDGGGVLSLGDTTLAGVEVVANAAKDNGGGLAVTSAALAVIGSDFADNVAENGDGGAIRFWSDVSEAHDLTIASSTIRSNTAGWIGGGLSIEEAANGVAMTDVVIEDNVAVSEGGGMHLEFAEATLVSVSVVANEITGDTDSENCGEGTIGSGAGMWVEYGRVDMVDSVVADNFSTAECTFGVGMGVFGDSNSVPSVIRSSSITGNSALGAQGAFGAGLMAGDLLLEDSLVEGNSAAGGWAGGVALYRTSVIRRSTISDNSSGFYGGVLVLGDATIEDSLIAGNAAEEVGGICLSGYGDGSATLALQNSTVTGNVSTGGLGAGGVSTGCYFPGAVALSIVSSTIVGNVGAVGNLEVREPPTAVAAAGSVIGDPSGGVDCSLVVPLVSGGSNFDSDGSCGLSGPGDVSAGGDPGLLFLADSGGPTLSRLPLPWSPLVDAAVGCGGLGFDQRGVVRPQGAACDVGAVELVAGEWSPTFSDVGEGHPFLVEIEWAAALGVAQGWPDGTFRPTEQVTRQATAVWLWRLAGEPAPVGGSPFTDTAGSPFEDAIVWLAEQGVAQGWPDGTFRPTAEVTRQAVSAWLWRLAGSPVPMGVSPFSDTAGSIFEEPITWLAERRVAQGWPDGTFRPTERVTRQAVAAWVCRYADLALI